MRRTSSISVVFPEATRARRLNTGGVAPDLSIPVIWLVDEGPAVAGRLDVRDDGLHLDGGSRDDRRGLDVAFAEIRSLRVGRSERERINGRRAAVLELDDGRRISFVGFDRPGALHDLVHHVERRIQPMVSAGLA